MVWNVWPALRRVSACSARAAAFTSRCGTFCILDVLFIVFSSCGGMVCRLAYGYRSRRLIGGVGVILRGCRSLAVYETWQQLREETRAKRHEIVIVERTA